VDVGSGVRLRIRPVLPTDAGRLGEEIHNADAQTLYMRFFTPKVRLDEARLRYLTELDYVNRLALVVFVDEAGKEGEGVAIARYEGRTDSDRAEIAVTVKETWRQAGLGKMLVELLEAAALDRGIKTFEAMYLGSNEGAAGLMRATGFEVDGVESGIVTVSKILSPDDTA
jgi:RimJ/RimL family protein N-acetyltransferase